MATFSCVTPEKRFTQIELITPCHSCAGLGGCVRIPDHRSYATQALQLTCHLGYRMHGLIQTHKLAVGAVTNSKQELN